MAHRSVADASEADASQADGRPDSINAPSALEIMRHRYQHGVNLGSCFVLEKWLTPRMFEQGAGSSELTAVQQSFLLLGAEDTRSKWETHWQTFLTDMDIDFLDHQAHCTAVRLPLGYFTLGAAFCQGTPFEAYTSVYEKAWPTAKLIIQRLYDRGIGVLVDLHALPGGANCDAHSGTNSGHAELWTSGSYLGRALDCVVYLAQELRNVAGVIGLQLCNEAAYGQLGLYNFYDQALERISTIDSDLPIYISDGWDFKEAIKYSQTKNSLAGYSTNPVIIDTHLYWTFSAEHLSKSPHQIISDVSQTLVELQESHGSVTDRGAASAIVGEYSCVLSEQTWSKVRPEDREVFIRQFGHSQSKHYQSNAGGGYFWTLKMDWMDGGEWGFVEQTKKGNINPPDHLTWSTSVIASKVSRAETEREKLKYQCAKGHADYWKRATNGNDGHFEHWRFEKGWDVGFADARAFFEMRRASTPASVGADKIGCLEIWVMKRIRDSRMLGSYVWEFETGLRQGIRAFEQVVGL